MHSSGSITRKFGPSWKQSTGQTSTQSMYLHLMQVSVTTKVMRGPRRPQGRGLCHAAAGRVKRGRVIRPARCGYSRRLERRRNGGARRPAARSSRKLRSANSVLGKAMSAQGMSAGSTSATSRLSGPGAELRLGEPGAEENMHLARAQHVRDRQQRADLHPRQSFLVALARRALLQRLAVFHEAGGNRPVAEPRLDRAPADEDAALVLRHAADHDLGILIVDRAAGLAHVARHMVARAESRRPTRSPHWLQKFMAGIITFRPAAPAIRGARSLRASPLRLPPCAARCAHRAA